MNSYRPYLIRALHEWISDNGMTPHLLVDAEVEGVVVPPGTVEEGRVVLNIAHRAVLGLEMGEEYVSFSARFGGVPQEVWVPISAVLALYARENGHGMAIPLDPYETSDDEIAAVDVVMTEVAKASDETSEDEPPSAPQPPKKGNHLRVVK